MSVKKRTFLTKLKDRGHFTQVPNEVLSSKELSSAEKMIWTYILSQSESWVGGRNSIATNIGISPKTVTKALKSLVSKGLLILTQERGKYSFEFTEQSAWRIEIRLPQAKVKKSPELEQDLLHIKEEKKSKASQPIFLTKEDKFHSLLTEWRESYPAGPSFLSGKRNSRPALKKLIQKCMDADLPTTEIRPDDLITLIFGSSPDESLHSWIRDLDRILKEQIQIIYQTGAVSDNSGDDMDDDVRAIYNDLVARNVTPADLNGMSLEDFAATQAYARQFPVLNTSEAIKNWKSMPEGPTTEEMLAALEEDISASDG